MKVNVIVATLISMGVFGQLSWALNSNEISAFTKGKAFIQNNNIEGYEKSLKTLKGTSVAPYLEYYYIQQNFKKLPRKTVLNFIQKNPNELFASS